MYVPAHIYYTVHKKHLAEEKLVNLTMSYVFANSNYFHRYTENVFGIWTDCNLFTKFFLANSFYLYGSPKFSPAKYFPCVVYVYAVNYLV